MPAPFVVAQLTDPHIGATWGVGDPAERLERAVAAVRGLRPAPAAVVVTGDVAENGADAEYTVARELLATAGVPVHVLAGNHDDRAGLRRHFDLLGVGAEPVQYAVDLGALRLVVLDSTIPGEAEGELDPARLGWLDEALEAAPEAPTLLAMHHPPLLTGHRDMDSMALREGSRHALGGVLARHRQVRRLLAGHVHMTVSGELGGCGFLALASSYVQVRLDFSAAEVPIVDDPAAIALHVWHDGALASYVQPVG